MIASWKLLYEDLTWNNHLYIISSDMCHFINVLLKCVCNETQIAYVFEYISCIIDTFKAEKAKETLNIVQQKMIANKEWKPTNEKNKCLSVFEIVLTRFHSHIDMIDRLYELMQAPISECAIKHT